MGTRDWYAICLLRTLIFRQDYRINRMMVWKIKNHVGPVIPSENILVLCLNNYELISNYRWPYREGHLGVWLLL